MASTRNPKRKRAVRKSSPRRRNVVIRNVSANDLLDRFRDFVMKDRDVQEALRNVRTARDATKLAARHGFQLTERDVRAVARMSGGSISLDDLGGLIGGAPCWCKKSVENSKSCDKK
jgi:Nif11 domain